MNQYIPRVHEYKKQEVQDVIRLFNEYPVVGILNLETLPSSNLQIIKKQLRDKAVIKFTKKTFMLKALDQIKRPNIDKLKENLQGVPALLFTKQDPFELYKILEKSKSNAAAKPGQIAPEDLTISAGPTNFPAGPMIGEFGQLGIKTEVKEGKISIKEEKTLVKSGQEISQKAADILSKLGVEPMKIGLNLLLTYQNGEILTKDILYINEEEFINNIKLAYQQALNLSLNASYPTSENIKLLIMKAQIESEALAAKIKFEDSPSKVKESGEAKETQPQIEVKHHQENKQVSPEVKVQEQRQEQKEDPKSTSDNKVEVKSPVKAEDMKMAEQKWQEIVEKTVKIEKSDESSKKEKDFKTAEQDVSKLINQLKDKKSKGEL